MSDKALVEALRKVQPEYKELVKLRDKFAKSAMQAIISSIVSETEWRRLKSVADGENITLSAWIARDAYKQANAMLVARNIK